GVLRTPRELRAVARRASAPRPRKCRRCGRAGKRSSLPAASAPAAPGSRARRSGWSFRAGLRESLPSVAVEEVPEERSEPLAAFRGAPFPVKELRNRRRPRERPQDNGSSPNRAVGTDALREVGRQLVARRV